MVIYLYQNSLNSNYLNFETQLLELILSSRLLLLSLHILYFKYSHTKKFTGLKQENLIGNSMLCRLEKENLIRINIGQ